MNFASDNTSTASDQVMQALVKANAEPLMPYGNDAITAGVENKLKDVFECGLKAFPVATGSAANALALSCMTPSFGSIYCHTYAHISVDECGAPELHTGGAKLVTVGGNNGKICPDQLDRALKISGKGDVHHVQPAVLSITQLTEMGTAYSLSEIQQLVEIARGYDLKVHMDGARFANALMSQNHSPAELTWKAGVDVLSFGASKNGAMAAEAVVFFDKDLAKDFAFRRKRGGHLFSKMRFISAQLDAYLSNDHWLDNAKQANAAAAQLEAGLQAANIQLMYPRDGNQLFPLVSKETMNRLREKGAIFYEWPWEEAPNPDLHTIRLVCAFNTDQSTVQRFLDLI